MERELLFRAFQDNIMYYQEKSGIYGTKYFLDKLYEDAALMQFTGLFDKNRKKIFEGDILSCITYERLRVNIQVYYTAYHFATQCYQIGKYSQIPIWQLESHFCYFEVIGNIHEHPQLLNENPTPLP